MQKIITHLFTETDNKTHDLFRYLCFVSIVVGLGLSIYATIFEKHFDIENFGIGVGALFAGVGASLKLKPEAKGVENECE